MAVLSQIGLYSFLNLVSPGTAGPWGILAVFAMVYILSFSVLMLIARLVGTLYRMINPSKVESQARKDRIQAYRKKSSLIIAAVSMVPIFIMSLNSIGNLGFADVVLIISIEFLLVFYILKKS